MNFFSIAIKNVRKRLFSYLTYFISTAFAVTVFYIFCSIYFNEQFSSFRVGMGKMGVIFKASAFAVFLFSSIFVFYSNKFFIKTRKKEMAIYSLLGMQKKDIGRMLFYETFTVGIFSVFAGILIGMVFSRFFSMVLLKLMAVSAYGTDVAFVIEWQPAILSIIVFAALFAVNAVNAYQTIYKYKLIDLLSADKEGERAPSFSPVGALLSIVLIAASYIIFLNFKANVSGTELMWPALFACALLATGTYLLFHNMITLFAKKLKSNTKYYYRTKNFLSTSQLIYRITDNANMLCLVALLSALTITMVSATFAMYNSMIDVLPTNAPFSYFYKNVNSSTNDEVMSTVKQDKQIKLLSTTKFDVLSSTATIPGYSVDNYQKTNKGEAFDISILKLSDYQAIVKNQNHKDVIPNANLQHGECLFIDANRTNDYSKNLSGSQVSVNCGENQNKYKITSTMLYKYLGMSTRATIVVSDSDYKEFLTEHGQQDKSTFTGLMFDAPAKSADLVEQLNSIVPEDNRYKSYIEWYKISFAQYGAYIFIGMFLGILFLLAASSIIFYKQLMEAREEKKRYDILKKVGMNRREAKQSIKKQLASVFFLPLIIGLLHSFFGLLTYQNLMSAAYSSQSSVFVNSAVIVLIYILIYGFFYSLSVRSYLRTVWDKKA